VKIFYAALIGGLMTLGCGFNVSDTSTPQTPQPETRSIEMTVVAEMPPGDVIDLWTTVAGASRFFAPASDIGSEVGNPYVIIFDPENDPEGANHGTKGATIRSLEPGKHIAFGWTFPPFGSEFNTKPFPTWVEIRVEEFAGNPSHSIVHFAHHGFPTDPAWDEIYRVFKDGNWPLVLNRLLVFCRDGVSPAWGDPEGDSIDKVLLVDHSISAPTGEVWRAWTTKEGLEAFLCEQATVELRPGGPYEVLFSVEAPEGQRGSEGCQVVDVIPETRLTFTWNSPPSLPEVRNQRTNVIVELTPSEDGRETTVRLLSIGWGTGDQWDASYRYFEAAWSTVFDWLEASFDPEQTNEPIS